MINPVLARWQKAARARSVRRVMITPAQIRAIRARQRMMGMDDEIYREVIAHRYGVQSTKALTRAEGNDLLCHLWGGPKRAPEEQAEQPPATANDGTVKITRSREPARRARSAPRRRRRETPVEIRTTREADGHVVRLATVPQKRLIVAMVREIKWRSADGYRNWLRANIGIEQVRTLEEASRVIEGLKGIKQHGGAS